MTDEKSLAIPDEEVQQANKLVSSLREKVSALTVESPDDVSQAADLLNSIKQTEQAITARKEEITRPLMQGLASVRNMIKPMELGLADVKKLVKAKVLAYEEIRDQKAEDDKKKITDRVAKGTLKVETAVDKLNALEHVPATVHGAAGKITTRRVTKVRIVDETLLPREYLVPNMTAITEAVLRNGLHVSGVETYEDKIIST